MGKKSIMASVHRFLILLCLFCCSVNDEDPTTAFAGLYSTSGPGYRFTVDPVKYQQLDFNRKDPSMCQVSFEIKSIKRNQNELTLEIERPKGCNGVYELVWDGKWQESLPRGMQVYLTGFFSNCSTGSETEIDIVKIDLAEALREPPSDLFTIYLREHCSFRDFNCVGNCNLNI